MNTLQSSTTESRSSIWSLAVYRPWLAWRSEGEHRQRAAALHRWLGLSRRFPHLFPLFFAGPFAEVPPSVVNIWLVRVAELAPLWDAARHRFSDCRCSLGRGDRSCSSAWFGFAASTADRVGLVLIALVVFLGLCDRSIRFAVYPAALGSIPIAAWAVERLAADRVGAFSSRCVESW